MPLNRNERPEVCVCLDKDTVFGNGKGKDDLVIGRLKSSFAYMRRVMPRSVKRYDGRDGVVYEKSQEPSGSSRSRTASAA